MLVRISKYVWLSVGKFWSLMRIDEKIGKEDLIEYFNILNVKKWEEIKRLILRK